MAIEVVLPRLGWNMESGSVSEWCKHEGESVEPGEILFVVEGEKATQEVEALDAGILHLPSGSPAIGQQVPVGTLLAYLLEPGERVPDGESAGKEVSVTSVAPVTAGLSTETLSAASTAALPDPAISPRAKRVARELRVEWQALRGSGSTGRIVERDVRNAMAASQAEGRVSPLAKRVAAELGVDVGELSLQAHGKRIGRADVEAAATPGESSLPAGTEPTEENLTVSPPAPAMPSHGARETVRMAFTGIRRITAEHMALSSRTVAPVTLNTEADASELVALRQQLKAAGESPLPSFTDLMAKLTAQALLEHPALNARLEGDEIVQLGSINVGIAVDGERGLMVPVLHDVQARSLREIAAESAALIGRARAGHSALAELQGGTFTITNLGMFEIDAFTPIINLPEAAVLGMGRIVARQVVVDPEAGVVAIRRMMALSLTFDHRLVDGAPAARFLQRVKHFVEQPYLWIAGLR